MAKWPPEMDDEGQPRHFTQAGVKAAINSVQTTPVPLTPDVLAEIRPHLDGFAGSHHLKGFLCNSGRPIALLAAPINATDRNLSESPLRLLPWGWPGRYGASLTITAFFEGSQFQSRLCIDKCSTLLDALAQQPVRLVMLRGLRPILAWDVDFASSEEARKNIESHIAAVKGYTGTVLDDSAVQYWETIECQSTFHPFLTAADQLSLGWYREFNRNAAGAKEWLDSVRKSLPFPGPSVKPVPPGIEELITVLNGEECQVSTVLDFLAQRFDANDEAQPDFIRDWFEIDARQTQPWEE